MHVYYFSITIGPPFSPLFANKTCPSGVKLFSPPSPVKSWGEDVLSVPRLIISVLIRLPGHMPGPRDKGEVRFSDSSVVPVCGYSVEPKS